MDPEALGENQIFQQSRAHTMCRLEEMAPTTSVSKNQLFRRVFGKKIEGRRRPLAAVGAFNVILEISKAMAIIAFPRTE